MHPSTRITRRAALAGASAAFATRAFAQASLGQPRIERLDPALDAILDANLHATAGQAPALAPAEAQKKFVVPEDFEVRLFAAEPDVHVCEMIQLSADGRHRARTWHWFRAGKLYQIWPATDERGLQRIYFDSPHPRNIAATYGGDSRGRFEPDGTLSGYIGSCIDLTERKEMEDELRKALKEKESLLREVHHRVKNNLQTVASLLRLRASGADPQRALADSVDRTSICANRACPPCATMASATARPSASNTSVTTT